MFAAFIHDCSAAGTLFSAHPNPQTTSSQNPLQVTPGSHNSEGAVNKQLADKERVAAALENPNLLDMVEKCLSGVGGGLGV